MRCRRYSHLVTALVLAVALGACGSDDSAADDPRTEAQLAADREAAAKAVLVLDDFPDGWTSEPFEEDPDDPNAPDVEAEMAECLGVDESEFDDSLVNVDSDTFLLDAAEVDSDVSMAPTLAEADREVEVLTRPEARGCFEAGFEKAFTYGIEHPAEGDEVSEGLELGEITFRDLSFDDVGQDSRAFRVSVPLTTPEGEATLYFDLVFIRVGRALGSISFLDFAPFDQGVATDLARAMASRMPTA